MLSEKKGSIVRKPKSNKNYINGPDFYLALVDHNNRTKENIEKGKPLPQISRYIGQSIMHIAENLGKKINFAAYSFREEMVSDAIEKMLESVDKYDVDYNKEKPNPFAYFTQIAWNIFLQRIAKEKKEQYLKHKNFSINFYNEMLENRELVNDGNMFNNEDHNRVLDEFENKKEKSAGYSVHKNLSYPAKKKKEEKENTHEQSTPNT